jgi:hypothetical protein
MSIPEQKILVDICIILFYSLLDPDFFFKSGLPAYFFCHIR